MPTYEYRCKACEHTFDAVQSFTDDPLTECPACGGELRKLFGNVAINFKGSGFYRNDSRTSVGAKNGSAKKDAGSDGASTSSGSEGSSSSSGSDGSSKSGDGGSSDSSSSKPSTPSKPAVTPASTSSSESKSA
jgi:putative FmdB family regulatory protein